MSSTQPAASAAWNDWLDAHAEWRRGAADLVHGRIIALRDAPRPPDGRPPYDDVGLTLRIATAADELARLRDQAALRIGGELQAALAYRTAGR